MDRDKIIDGLRMTMDLFTFDPTTGEEKDPDDLNDLDRATYDACKGALEILERLDTDSDTISRQAAIDALHTWFRDGFDEDKWWNSTHVLAAIEGLPPAPLGTNLAEVGTDTISRQAAIDGINKLMEIHFDRKIVLKKARDVVEQLPPAQPERIKGRWIYHPEWANDGECGYECSVCHMGSDIDYNFCMRCGADMREMTT